MYKILSIDGGGIRGLLTCTVMERLLEQIPGLLNNVDLIAGTSTGGIIALGLAHGLTPTDLHKFYYERGKKIFDDSWLDNIRDLGGLAGAQYDNTHLKEELEDIFGDTLLKQLKRKVLISSFDLDNEAPDEASRSWKPKFWHNFDGSDSDGNARVAYVALFTSAAPTYFPTADRFVDGGVIANNPSMAALAQALDTRASSPKKPKLEEIVLLSLGTGQSLCRIEGKNLDWGIAHWARPLVSILIEGSVGIADYQCRQILGDRYFRLNGQFPPDKKFDMDDIGKMDDLVSFARTSVDTSAAVTWLKKCWV